MKLGVLGLSVDSHAATSHVACAAQMGIAQNAPICVSSERFFSHYHRACQGLHLDFVLQRCIIIKIAFSLSCPHTSARPDTSGSNEPKTFGRYSALVVTRACSSTGYGAFQFCICTQNWTEKPISHSPKLGFLLEPNALHSSH